MNEYTRSVIVGALMDPYRPVVETAAAILRDDHCAATFHALVAGMPRGSQYEAAFLLAEYKEPQYIKLMGKLLHHERMEVRRPVALAMGLSESRLAIEPLRRATNDADPHVRGEVELALRRLGFQPLAKKAPQLSKRL